MMSFYRNVKTWLGSTMFYFSTYKQKYVIW